MCSNRTICGDIGEMYTKRLIYQHSVSKQLLKRMSDEKYKVAGAWNLDDDNVKEFKEKIKNKLIEIQDGKCAYCELPLQSRNPEIDHIAPKGGKRRVLHPECTFLPLNLVYSCHNCNSTICKGQKDIVLSKNGKRNYRKWTFKIVHPYIDDPMDYFEVPISESGEKRVYPVIKRGIDREHKNKAKTTIKMFGLDGEKVLELAKEQLAVRYPEELQSIIEVISSHRPD